MATHTSVLFVLGPHPEWSGGYSKLGTQELLLAEFKGPYEIKLGSVKCQPVPFPMYYLPSPKQPYFFPLCLQLLLGNSMITARAN